MECGRGLTGVLHLGKERLHLPTGLHFLGQQAVVNEFIERRSNTRFPPKTHHGTVPVLQLRRSASDYLLVHGCHIRGWHRVNDPFHAVYNARWRLHTSRQSDSKPFLHDTLYHVSDLGYLTPDPDGDMYHGSDPS
jgi:hypothetical protein